MKILIVDSYYPRFIANALPHVLEGKPDYTTLLDRMLRLRFGTADFYSRHLRASGHQASDIIFNCEPLQLQWAAENGMASLRGGLRLPGRIAGLPLIRRLAQATNSLQEIALQQIRRARPDVLYLQDLNLFRPEVLHELRRTGAVRMVVGQIACPLPPEEYLRGFDLILTSFPHYVDRFRERGIGSEYFRIGFDPSVLAEVAPPERDLACTFVGGLSPAHAGRLEFLEHLAHQVDISFFGYGADSLDARSPIPARHNGEAWALDMYRALARSRITVNVHIDVAENNANNMRLYEATGCGALLLTDMKDNLPELFEVDKEVITYRTPDEAVEKILYYVAHPEEAKAIALAGQQRTLREHTYQHRMGELAGILETYLSRTTASR